VNDSGLAVAAWTDDSEVLVAERRGSARFSAPVVLNGGERRRSGIVRVAVGRDGTRAVAWRAGREAANLFVRVRPAGGTWGRRARFPGSFFDLAVGHDGTVHLVTNRGKVLVRERPPRGRWSGPTQLSSVEEALPLGGAVTLKPVIRVGGRGHVLVAWTVGEGFPRQSLTRFGSAFRPPTGPWLTDETAVVAPDPLTRGEPAIAVGRSGDALLTWRGRDGRLRSAYRSVRGGWRSPQEIGAVRPDSSSPGPSVGIDSAGNAVVVFAGPRGGPGGSVSVARRSARTGAWSGPRRVSSARRGLLDLALALGGSNGVGRVVWQEARGARGEGLAVLSARLSSTTGGVGAIVPVAPSSPARRPPGYVRAGASRAGAVTAVWQQPSSGGARVVPGRASLAFVTARSAP